MLTIDSGKANAYRMKEARKKSLLLRKKQLEQEIASNLASVRKDAGTDTSNLLAQMGHPLESSEVQKRLKLCNPNLVFERSINFPELTGVYLLKDGIKKHICGMESGTMPEFSVLHKTKKKVANPDLLGIEKPTREVDWKYVDTFLDETRGWRTVLLRLLKAGLINEGHVRKHFEWNPTRSSEIWHTQTA